MTEAHINRSRWFALPLWFIFFRSSFNLPTGFQMRPPLRLFVLTLSPAYQITYHLNSSNSNTATVDVLNPSARQYTVTSLKPESIYVFRITAQTRKGWGEAAEALVVTTEKRGDHVLLKVRCFLIRMPTSSESGISLAERLLLSMEEAKGIISQSDLISVCVPMKNKSLFKFLQSFCYQVAKCCQWS